LSSPKIRTVLFWHIAAIVSADFGWAGSGLERAAEEAGSQNEPKIAKLYSLRNVSVDLPSQGGSKLLLEKAESPPHPGNVGL